MASQRMSATETASRIDWLALSEASQQTVREIAIYVWSGYQTREIAAALGVKPAQVQARLARLRAEIRAQLAEAES